MRAALLGAMLLRGARSLRAPRVANAFAPRAARSRLLAATADPLYITTPIYYVNAAPHIGHAYTRAAAPFFLGARRASAVRCRPRSRCGRLGGGLMHTRARGIDAFRGRFLDARGGKTEIVRLVQE